MQANRSQTANILIGFLTCLAVGCQGSSASSSKPLDKPANTKADMTAEGPSDKDAPKEFSATPSGLKYKILRKGTGHNPNKRDTVTVHYRGWLDNGKEFDSSYKRGESISFPLSGVIPGWTEGMQLVAVGGKIELEIPSELGYGPQGAGADIPPNSTLHFIVELIESTKKEAPAGEGPSDKEVPAEFTTTPSGLKYKILRKSDKKMPTSKDTVTVNYRGWLDNGKEFDSSYERGEPISFPLNGVIAGWTEGMQLVGIGGKIELEIPSKLGYGERGAGRAIPPNSTLHFIVELIDIK